MERIPRQGFVKHTEEPFTVSSNALVNLIHVALYSEQIRLYARA